MKQRVITAVIGVLVFIPFVLLGGAWFTGFVYLLASVGLYEIAQMKGIPYFNEIGLITTLSLAAIVIPIQYWQYLLPLNQPSTIFFVGVMLLLILTVYRHRTFNFVDASTLIFATLYLGFGFRYYLYIRELGLATFIYLLLVIWSTDTGAYFIGKRYGKHPLAKEISPAKTIEGAVGGVLSALVITTLYVAVFPIKIPHDRAISLLTIMISMAGQFGDLVESAYKRYFNVKDSGNFLPGHGGVLDRFDSTLFASTMLVVWLNL